MSFRFAASAVEASFMYLLAKIHKQPMKTRAIISYAGSLCHGIAKWLDVYLKRIVKHMPYIATSSASVVKEITSKNWPPNCKIFTCDAVSMYTNIHLKHALPVIKDFLTNTELGRMIMDTEHINISALLAALDLVMNNNVFRFGDTYFLQKNGTAMGTPPAPTYATLYFAIWEHYVIPSFPELQLYFRYINDGFGIWHSTNPEEDDERWSLFQERMNDFGNDHPFFRTNTEFLPLMWEFSERTTSTVFLDLTVTCTASGTISTTLYEKPLNLHLYIPPHSCHAPGILKGFVFGCANRPADRIPFMKKTFLRLIRRGHDPCKIRPFFNQAIAYMALTPCQRRMAKKKKEHNKTPLFLHLPYNPQDPPSSRIQRIFRSTIIQPSNDELHISNMETENPSNNGPPDFDTLTVCYHGQSNLGNLLSPRKLRLGDYSVKEALDKLRDTG